MKKLGLIAMLVVLPLLQGCGVEYSNGTRIGQIFKISHKGVFWKTWEGDLNEGGVSSSADGIIIPNIWSFSVINMDVVKQIQHAQDSGHRIKLTYKQYFAVWPSWGKTNYIIIRVDEV